MPKVKSMITPVGDRVLVEVLEKNEETKSGIIIPESNNNGHTHIGKIISVGQGRRKKDGKLEKMPFKVGQTIAYSFSEKIDLGDSKNYHIVSESSVLGIFNK